MCARGASFSSPASLPFLAYFFGRSGSGWRQCYFFLSSCAFTLTLTQMLRITNERSQSFSLAPLFTALSPTDPLFGAVRNEVEACRLIDRLPGRHDTRNDYVTRPPIASALLPEMAPNIQGPALLALLVNTFVGIHCSPLPSRHPPSCCTFFAEDEMSEWVDEQRNRSLVYSPWLSLTSPRICPLFPLGSDLDRLS